MCMDQSVVVPMKRVWLGIASRLGIRRTTGLRKLRKEVRTCEYRDVHVMWEMLRKVDAQSPLSEEEAAADVRKRRGGVVEPARLLLLRVLKLKT